MVTNEDIIEHCIQSVSRVTEVSPDKIVRKRRHREWVEARYLLFYMASVRYGITSVDIGRLTNFNHATVLHGIGRMRGLADVKVKYSLWLDRVMNDEFDIDLSLRNFLHSIIVKGAPTYAKVDQIIKALREHEEINLHGEIILQLEGDKDAKRSKKGFKEMEHSDTTDSNLRENTPRIERKQLFNK
tara:strand:- start:1171 stop:1728 length:558 start_codon:yes stop_codon:yes gene_type:complete